MTTPALVGVAYAEANHGRWVANCPAPYCTSAMQLIRGQETFECGGNGGCGAMSEVIWPADPEAIEGLLLMRPAQATRNWLPGETLEQLLEENALHDCIPPEWAALGAGETLVLADIVEQRVVGGLLHRQLEAAGLRREIGA